MEKDLQQAIDLIESEGYAVSRKKHWYESIGVWGCSLTVMFLTIGLLDAYIATLATVPSYLNWTHTFLHGALMDFGKYMPYAALTAAFGGLFGRVRKHDITL